MIAIAADRYDLPRWILSAAVVVGMHAAFVTMLMNWREPMSGDEGTEAILDLAPYTAPQVASKNDLAPGPEQQEAKSTPDAEPPKAQETPLEKIEPPPPLPDADVQLPAEAKPPEKPKEQPTPPVHETTSPPRPRPSAAQVASWHRKIALQVERHKSYPVTARAASDGNCGTGIYARSKREGFVEPRDPVIGRRSSRPGNNRHRAARAAISPAAAKYAG
jgi:type IV secretory pathway VirB10-like protein